MTTKSLKPRPQLPQSFDEAEALYKKAGKVLGKPKKRTTTKYKTMTEQTYPVTKPTVTKQPTTKTTPTKTFKHSEPVVVNSHLENVPVISSASYIKDARNRWYIHSTEVKELWDQHVNIFNSVKPYVVSAVNKVKELTSKKV